MEIKTIPVIDESGNATFKDKCTIADILRYAIACSDIQTVKALIDEMDNLDKQPETLDGEQLKPTYEQLEELYNAQCGCTDEWAEKLSQAEAEKAELVKANELISLEKMLPIFGNGERVIIFTQNHNFSGEQYFDVEADALNDAFYEHQEDMPEVCQFATHWMPLPAPPKDKP